MTKTGEYGGKTAAEDQLSTIEVNFDVPAVMRDGTVLRANVYRPVAPGSYPVAIARTPYGKDALPTLPFLDMLRLARAGYIVAIQDVRGRGASDGLWEPFKNEGLDGYDSVAWAASLPGSSGSVGMFGASYVGFTQWITAVQRPPQLKAIVPSITWAHAGEDGFLLRGGALELGLITQWLLQATGADVLTKRHTASSLERSRAMKALIKEIDRLPHSGYMSLPLDTFEPLTNLDLLDEILRYTIEHHEVPDYCSPFADASAYSRIEVPALILGGWYDAFCAGPFRTFNGVRTAGATAQARQSKLLVGPWSHSMLTGVVGEQDFGASASLDLIDTHGDLTMLTQRWFDHYLKDISNGIEEEPTVKLFVMGENRWRSEHEWPLPGTRFTPYYLHSRGGLSPAPPGDNEPPDHYTYDPSDPTPTVGGAVQMSPVFTSGVQDQSVLNGREDVLVYTSEPLEHDLEVTGPVTVKLWAATDGLDTDFVACLIDVHPNGYSQNLCDGIIRARFRNGRAPELLEPGQPYEFAIDLWATSNLFRTGHRICLRIASASFPRWDRNLNTKEPPSKGVFTRIAHQTVYHSAPRPSHVLLPVVLRQLQSNTAGGIPQVANPRPSLRGSIWSNEQVTRFQRATMLP